jgi:hypothetical protein
VAAGISVGLGAVVDRLERTTPQQRTYARLDARPRTDALAQADTELADRVRGALFDEVPAFDWTLLVPPTFTTCQGAPGALGEGKLARSLNGGTWSGDPIPKAQWAVTFRALHQALSHAGFTSFDVRYGGPDEQTVSVDDSWGSTLQFTLEPDSTTFSLQSTCNLLPSAKRPPR